MQVIYHWAFAVAPALCPPVPPTLKSGGGHVPLLDIWLRRLWFSLLSSAEIIAAQQEIRISESDPASNADRSAPIRTLGE